MDPAQKPLASPEPPVPQPIQRPESTDQVRKLGVIVEKAVVPPELKEILLERVSRLAMMRSTGGFMSSNYILEYETTSTYINWAVKLPWATMSKDILDPAHAREVLDKNHYGLEPIKNRMMEYISTIILNIKNNTYQNVSKSPVLCFVGLAGTGKTTIASSIAESLGRKFERIPFGGMADARVLRGQSRAFPDAEPGAIIKKLVHAGTRNPVILLDEMDRVSENARGDIMGVLLELLDPGQNKAFTDHYIDYPFDLSKVLFIATGNNTTNISTAVLDRLEVIQMPSYTDDEKSIIAHKYLFNKIRSEAGLTEQQLVVDESLWPSIIRPLGFDSGIRSLQRCIETICRRAAREIVEGKTQQVVLTEGNIRTYLPL